MRIFVRIWLLALGLLIFTGGQQALAVVLIQRPDNLIYEGKKYVIDSYPLESYYGPGRPRPKFKVHNPDIRRGYTATWEIDKSTLYLKRISASVNGRQVFLDNLFPGQKDRVAASWFTGKLRGFRGGPWLILTIKDGKVANTEVLDNKNKKLKGEK